MPTSLDRVPKKPTGCVDVVLDTDAYNEIDDQFAISYLVKSPDKARVKAIFAAPYFNTRSTSPEDGMEKSYQEIIKLLSLCGPYGKDIPVYRGSKDYMKEENIPVESEAARALCELASSYSKENPLYVITIGCVTNIASALLMKPEIADNIVIVSLIGNDIHWIDNREFNMSQDLMASRILFSCASPFVQLPCMSVVSAFRTSKPELDYWLKGKNPLADYLVASAVEEAEKYAKGQAWTRVIWDVTAVAWVLDRGDDFMIDEVMPCPMPGYDDQYHEGDGRYFVCVRHIERDKLFTALFKCLGE